MISFFLIFSAESLYAKEAKAPVIKLEQAIQLAKENSEDLALAINAVQKNESLYRDVLGTALPQVSFDTTWQKYFQNARYPTMNYQLSTGISISQTLWAFGRVGAAINAADHGLEAGKLQKQITEDEVVYFAKSAYFLALYTQYQVKIANQSLQNAKDNLSILTNKFSGGRPPQGDFVRLQSDVMARTPNLKNTEASHESALWALAITLGFDSPEQFKLPVDYDITFPKLNTKELLSKLNDEQIRIRALNESLKYAKEAARVYKAADLPSIVAIGSYNKAALSADPVSVDDLSETSFVGVSLQWNIWDGGSTRAKYQQALADQRAAALTLKKTKEQLKLQLVSKITSYNKLSESNAAAKKAVELAQKSFNISQRKFRTGQTSVTEINGMDAALTQAQLGYAANVYQIHSTLAEIQNLLNLKEGALK